MLDIIVGTVTRIIDGNTFTVQVTHIGTQNKFRYGVFETIRVAGRQAAPLHTPEGQQQRIRLQQQYMGKTVQCNVHYRDEYNIVLANVLLA